MQRFCVLFLSIVFSAAAAELVLYFAAFPKNALPVDSTPGSFEPDPEVGWLHKPGNYSYPNLDKKGASYQISYLPDRSRNVGREANETAADVLLLGCSFVEGFGLDDHQTVGWKLQSLMPDVSVKNYGTGGYGTLQSLLFLKKLLREGRVQSSATIIYAFADFHTLRNVKNPFQRYWHHPGIYPYCSRTSCSTWSGKSMSGVLRHSRLLSFIENKLDFLAVPEEAEQAEITLKLLQELKAFTAKHGLRFVIAGVSIEDARWLERLRKVGMPFVNCDTPTLQMAEYRLRDGHPNGLWTASVATCLEKYLRTDSLQAEED